MRISGSNVDKLLHAALVCKHEFSASMLTNHCVEEEGDGELSSWASRRHGVEWTRNLVRRVPCLSHHSFSCPFQGDSALVRDGLRCPVWPDQWVSASGLGSGR